MAYTITITPSRTTIQVSFRTSEAQRTSNVGVTSMNIF